ncbi:MAG: lipopolysaccharide kinase InaA family protein, partial [Promethearchaeota archaeon]
IGKLVAQMHEADIAHGDLTTSNILITSDQMLYFIDFGLSQRDIDIEEKAMDIHLFIRVLQSTHAQYFDVLYPAFLDGYRDNAGDDTAEILQRVDKIALRGRYILKEQRRRNRSELKK